jgi:tellurite resistance protein TehA-like permease
MSIHEAAHTGVPAHPSARSRSLFRDLDRPADVVAYLGPNWFASVMGTGIVTTAAATLPVQWPGLRGFATAIWVLSAVWLITVTGAEIVHWTRHRDAALGHARDPVMVQFYGAPPMALLTVGAGALLLGPGLIGAHAAITIDAVLWALGTITGLAASLAVPLSHGHQVAGRPGRRLFLPSPRERTLTAYAPQH